MTLRHLGATYSIRLAGESDVPALRRLLNAAYKELSDMGLNYTATYQDEAETLKQLSSQKSFLVFDAEELVGTIGLRNEDWTGGRKSAYLCKFAIQPERKKQGLGAVLMKFVEDYAKAEGYEVMQLDTAKPAAHLVDWYKRLGYEIISETRFDGKSYESWIFEKPLY